VVRQDVKNLRRTLGKSHTKSTSKSKTNDSATSKSLELQRLQDSRFKLETVRGLNCYPYTYSYPNIIFSPLFSKVDFPSWLFASRSVFR
jgi:hypothetical protein